MENDELSRLIEHVRSTVKMQSEMLYELDKKMQILEIKCESMKEKIADDYERFDHRIATDYERLDARFDKLDENHKDFLIQLINIKEIVAAKEATKTATQETSKKYLFVIYSVMTLGAALGLHNVAIKYLGWL